MTKRKSTQLVKYPDGSTHFIDATGKDRGSIRHEPAPNLYVIKFDTFEMRQPTFDCCHAFYLGLSAMHEHILGDTI